MRVIQLEKPKSLRWLEVPEPVRAGNEALVRVIRCGVCGTDIHAMAGHQPLFSYPRVLGHELCVEVISAPEHSQLQPGQFCAVEPYYFCGDCPACRTVRKNCCQKLKVVGVHVDGGHAPYMAIPADKLHPAPGLAPDEIALVEPLVIGAHALERAALKAGEPALVIGLGPIGVAAAIMAKTRGARLACADIQKDRLKFACGRMGLGTPFEADASLASALQNHFGQLPAVVIDATGNATSMKSTVHLAEPGGRIVLVGFFNGEMSFDDPTFHRRELTLLASRCALSHSFPEVIRLLTQRQIEARPMITHRFPFAEALEKLPDIHRETGLMKAMIDFDGVG